MPLRKDLAVSHRHVDETVPDGKSAPDEQPEPQITDAAAPVATRRRWGLFRRRAKAAEPESFSASAKEVAEPQDADVPTRAPRRPVGKASRAVKAVPEPEPTVGVQTVNDTADAGDAEDASQEERILVPHRPAGKGMVVAAAVAGVVLVGTAAFAGATLQPYLADRALVHTKLDVAKTAANAISTLWTYTPDNMDKLPERSAGYLGGDFANEYRKYIDAIVAANKQAQVTNTTEVMGAAVETVTPTEATALVYTNSVATSPNTKDIPSLRYLSYRLTMQRHDAKWLITRMSTVTSFDLTPQL
jgi:Mce-associated membrane protein